MQIIMFDRIGWCSRNKQTNNSQPSRLVLLAQQKGPCQRLCVETHVWLVAVVPAFATKPTHQSVYSRDLETPVFGDFREDEQPGLGHLRLFIGHESQ